MGGKWIDRAEILEALFVILWIFFIPIFQSINSDPKQARPLGTKHLSALHQNSSSLTSSIPEVKRNPGKEFEKLLLMIDKWGRREDSVIFLSRCSSAPTRMQQRCLVADKMIMIWNKTFSFVDWKMASNLLFEKLILLSRFQSVSVWIYWAGVTCIDSNVGFKYLFSASCSLVLCYKTAVHSELLMQSGGHGTTVQNIKIKCIGNQTILSTALCLSRAPRYIVQQDC